MSEAIQKDGIQLDTSNWAKPKLKKVDFFKGITKILVAFKLSYSPNDVIDGIFDIGESIKIEKTAGQLGWGLIWRSLIESITSLVIEQISTIEIEKEDIVIDELEQSVNALFEDKRYFITEDFFMYPEKLPLVNALKPYIGAFLKNFSLLDFQINNILNRFDNYFIFSLAKEWRRNFSAYQSILNAVSTPFSNAESKAYEWLYYKRYLMHQTQEPVFGESFSLNDIYIPLRGYYKVNVENKKIETHEKHIIDVEEYMLNWVESPNRKDSLKILTGGPGYGKSSLLKVLAAKIATNNHKVLFIPLHHFSLQNDLWESISKFFSTADFFRITDLSQENNLLLIFDGLDELAMQGKLLADIAQKFLVEIKNQVNISNMQRLKIKVIVSGRDVIIQQNQSEFRQKEQVIHLLPYHIDKESRKYKYSETKHVDRNNLLDHDQRLLWWQKYSSLKNKLYTNIPKELDTEELKEITSQPLLNYLVALSYDRGKIDFSKNPNLNDIYKDLLNAVYERNYSTGTLRGISSINETLFKRLLQEVAISAWHSSGRTTTVSIIEKHLLEGGLKKHFEDFLQDAKKGVVSLLTAFYFQQTEINSGEQTFEFTHKSFSEYLTATRIVSQIRIILDNVTEWENDFDKGYDIKEALIRWCRLMGPKALDRDVVKFLKNEIKNIEESSLCVYQKNIIKLINYTFKEDLPIAHVCNNSYKEMRLFAQNSEKAFFIILGIVASYTNTISEIDWQYETGLDNLIMRLSEKLSISSYVYEDFFNHINCSNQNLNFGQYSNYNFSNSDFSKSQMFCSYFVDCRFINANLYGADLESSVMPDSDLTNANLESTDLRDICLHGSSLNYANLKDAYLNDANLKSTEIKNANLEDANLTKADLTDADLTGSNLKNISLKGAILKNTRISRESLIDVHLTKKQLKDIIIV